MARAIYGRGSTAIRCTVLAHFHNGGFAPFHDDFRLSDVNPSTMEELCALASIQSLRDTIFESCFARKSPFDTLTEDRFQQIIVTISKNPRLVTPYDDSFLDGYAEYSYNKVFQAAWQLTETVPRTALWAHILYNLLYRCLTPTNFNPISAIKRWRLDDGERDYGFYLRSRLADLLAADKALLAATDAAVRISFYRRFRPHDFPKWVAFAHTDQEYFLDADLENVNLWRTEECRSALGKLSWDHPDPKSDLLMVNHYRAVESRMRKQHPERFAE